MSLCRKALGIRFGPHASAVSLDPQTDTGGVCCGKRGSHTLLWGGHRQDRMREDLWRQCLIAALVVGEVQP